MIDMIGMLYAAWRQKPGCGDKSRAVRRVAAPLSPRRTRAHLISTQSIAPATACLDESVVDEV